MSTTHDSATMDALLVEGAWLRRVAAALVSDPDDAEDLAQETWLVALRDRPRSAAAVRLWLRRVLMSRLRDAARARRRRAAREQAAMDEASSPVDPEALAARMELHHRVAGHMAVLEEPIRQVLFLRFVEGLEPVEVARRLGIPGGTVRWRLKRGLDELRARLDADFGGERHRWATLLLPLVPRGSAVGPSHAPGARTPSPPAHLLRWGSATAAKLALAGLVLAAGAIGASRACTGASPGAEKVAAGPRQGALDLDAVERRLAGPLQAPPPAPAAAPARPPACPAAEALEKERDALAAAAEPFRNPQLLFERSPRNLDAERNLKPLADEAFARVGQCGHSFECRGPVCRIEVVAPERAARESGGVSCVDIDPRIRLSDRVTILTRGDDGSAFDPLSRTWLRRQSYYLRLAVQSGEPIPHELRTPPELPAGWDRERPVPARLSPECEARTLHVRGEIEGLVQQIERDFPPRKVFASSAPNPALSREVADSLRPCLSAGAREQPVDVDCRGRTCALASRSGDSASAVRWKCPPGATPPGACYGDPEGDWWFARLLRCRDTQKGMQVVDAPRRSPSGQEQSSALVRVRLPEQREGVPGKLVLLSFARDRDFAGMVAECELRHPARGILLIGARVPETCGSADDSGPSQIGLEFGGELLGTELAACLAEKAKAALDGVELPRCVYGWRGEFRLEFPHPKIDIEAEQER